jgi:MtfA peptidase
MEFQIFDPDMLPYILLVICITIFLYMFLSVIYYTVRQTLAGLILYFRGIQIKWEYKAAEPLRSDDLVYTLKKFVPYFNMLSDQHKRLFIMRTQLFMNYHSFEGRNGIYVTEEMQIRIAATAVQLTFGLKEYLLRHFVTIVVYPDVYVSPATGDWHKGETNIRGSVVLSWKHFVEGFETTEDKLNLGLHELAHALDLGRLVKDADPFFFRYFLKWSAVANETYLEVNASNHHFLRSYAGTNMREFFAVSVEHFFEDPSGFANELPLLYQHLCVLLHQDPLRIAAGDHLNVKMPSNQPPSNLNDKDVLFESSPPAKSAVSSFLLPVVMMFIFIFIFRDDERLQLVIGMFVVLIVGGTIDYIRRANTVLLYPEYLVVKSRITGKVKMVIALENLISIEFSRGSNRDFKLTFAEGREIFSYEFLSTVDWSEYDLLKEQLQNRNVVMSF